MKYQPRKEWLYYLNDKPVPSLKTLCKLAGISDVALRKRIQYYGNSNYSCNENGYKIDIIEFNEITFNNLAPYLNTFLNEFDVFEITVNDSGRYLQTKSALYKLSYDYLHETTKLGKLLREFKADTIAEDTGDRITNTYKIYDNSLITAEGNFSNETGEINQPLLVILHKIKNI